MSRGLTVTAVTSGVGRVGGAGVPRPQPTSRTTATPATYQDTARLPPAIAIPSAPSAPPAVIFLRVARQTISACARHRHGGVPVQFLARRLRGRGSLLRVKRLFVTACASAL